MKRPILFFLFFCLIESVSAQRPADFELWTGGTFKLQFNKKIGVSLSEQFRFNDTISSLDKSFTEVGFKYSFNKHFSLATDYRIIARPGKKGINRVSLDAGYSWSKKDFPLSFDYRLRFQNEFGRGKTNIRNKVNFEYNLSKLVDPFISYEIFFRLNGKNEFRVSRFTVGLDWRIMKNFKASTFYRLQDDIFVKNPERQHILGLMFKYQLKLKKKKSAASVAN